MTQFLPSNGHYLVGRLRDYYAAEDIGPWLFARHPQLRGERAIDLINQGRSEEVIEVLERLDAGTHL